MSQALEAQLIQTFIARTSVAAAVGKDSSGNPAIFPYHQRDVDENVPYPHVTIARFGDLETAKFQDDTTLATIMDGPKFAICVWSHRSIDEAYTIYNMLDTVLRGPGSNIASSYFSIYKVKRTHLRDDLFDVTARAYHIHSEYSAWLQYTQYGVNDFIPIAPAPGGIPVVTAIPANRIVTLSGTTAILVDASLASNATQAVYITSAGQLFGSGTITDASFSFIPGRSVFLGLNGTITQTTPTFATGFAFLLKVGTALSGTSFAFDPMAPILLVA